MREKGKEQEEGAQLLPPAPARCAGAPSATVLRSHPCVPVRSGGMSQPGSDSEALQVAVVFLSWFSCD